VVSDVSLCKHHQLHDVGPGVCVCACWLTDASPLLPTCHTNQTTSGNTSPTGSSKTTKLWGPYHTNGQREWIH
jgi:hypothetical protein